MKKYEKIFLSIIDDINNGKYDSNEKLSSETELAAKYDVSISTIRKSLKILIDDGYIFARQGSGYYVQKSSSYRRLKLDSLYNANKSKEVSSTVLHFEIKNAGGDISEKLQIDKNEKIYFIKRLRYVDKEVQQLELTYVPVKLFPTLMPEVFEKSFYAYVENESGQKVNSASKEIFAINLNEEEAELLKRNPGDASLGVENYGFLSDGVQFEYSYNIHNDDKFIVNVSSRL